MYSYHVPSMPYSMSLQVVPSVEDGVESQLTNSSGNNGTMPPRGLSDIETIIRVARSDVSPSLGGSGSLSQLTRQSSRGSSQSVGGGSSSSSSSGEPRSNRVHQIPVQVLNEDARPLSSIEIAAIQRRLHFWVAAKHAASAYAEQKVIENIALCE